MEEILPKEEAPTLDPTELQEVIEQGYKLLEEATCIEDIYDLIDYLGEEVRRCYTHIGCKPGSYACCVQASSLPPITAAEWELILYYVKTVLPPVIQEEIVARARWHLANHKDALSLLQKNITDPQSVNQLQGYEEVLARSLERSFCPFLVVDKCGVYPVRPARCRAQGFFLTKIDEVIIPYTCQPEQQKIEVLFQKQGNRMMSMPLWNVFEAYIRNLNPEDSLVGLIPLWILAHVKGNQLVSVEELNPKPDMEQLLG